jgi:nucleoside 2-deoxyribosyltransferase
MEESRENKEYRVYMAGELFDLKHLAGNALIAEALAEVSQGRYLPVLPQDLELPSLDAKSIRDTDYKSLLECDAAVFQFDGTDLDSGTVAEFIAAKFADIPSVLLRTDLRRSGDRNERPWNLMCDSFPRTEALVVDAMKLYSKQREKGWMLASESIKAVSYEVATLLAKSLDEAVSETSVLDEAERASALDLIAKSFDM